MPRNRHRAAVRHVQSKPPRVLGVHARVEYLSRVVVKHYMTIVSQPWVWCQEQAMKRAINCKTLNIRLEVNGHSRQCDTPNESPYTRL